MAELELLRAKHSELESFFYKSKEESFFVKNLENVQGDERAPLILIPVMLERDRVRSRFKLKRREDDIEVNLSLQAKLKQDFGLDLPEIPEGDEWLPSDYYALVRQAISTKAKWTVEQDSMLLGFFSFSKFLLYRDLDPAKWPQTRRIDENPTVRSPRLPMQSPLQS